MYGLVIFMARHWKNNIQIWKFSIYFFNFKWWKPSKITPFSHFLFSISFLGDILLVKIRLIAWFWPIMNILNPILDKDSIYSGSNVVSCVNIPLPHLGSVFFNAKFCQHAFLFKTSLMMLSMWSWKMMIQYVIMKNVASICDPTKIFFKSKVYLPFRSPIDKIVIEIIVGWGTTISKPPRSTLWLTN